MQRGTEFRSGASTFRLTNGKEAMAKLKKREPNASLTKASAVKDKRKEVFSVANDANYLSTFLFLSIYLRSSKGQKKLKVFC